MCQQLQAKLYLSIIDDVIESMRELFLDEGLEDRVLDDLKHVSYIVLLHLKNKNKIHVMHKLDLLVRIYAVSSCCAALGVKDDAVKSNGRLQEK